MQSFCFQPGCFETTTTLRWSMSSRDTVGYPLYSLIQEKLRKNTHPHLVKSNSWFQPAFTHNYVHVLPYCRQVLGAQLRSRYCGNRHQRNVWGILSLFSLLISFHFVFPLPWNDPWVPVPQRWKGKTCFSFLCACMSSIAFKDIFPPLDKPSQGSHL